MRRFALKNGIGQVFDMMRTDAFFANPSGLGFEKSNDYIEIGPSFKLTTEKSSQKKVTGTMFFAGYKQYQEFADFISYKPLVLLYYPFGSDVIGEEAPDIFKNNVENVFYRLDCRVTSLEKGELNKDTSYLESQVNFTAETKWYRSVVYFKSAKDLTNAKYYDPKRDSKNGAYVYNYQYVESTAGTIPINCHATEVSPSIVTIFGPVENPIWSIVVNNQETQSGQLNYKIPDGDKLVINSRSNHLEISLRKVIDDTFLANLYEYVDFDRENFMLFPRGLSDFHVTGDSANDINVVVEVEEIHETV